MTEMAELMDSSKKNTVLVVDDEPMNIRALTHILAPDYTIYVEKDGYGCVETARELRPDLILLDVIMPARNGFETIEILKSDVVLKDIPVIFVTGLSNPQDEETGFNLGAADYINKPFSPAVVKLRVKNHIHMVNQMREIYSLSVTDTLTGIGNRRHFNNQLEAEWQRGLRQQKPVSFLIFDIDHFKAFNDKYGHIQGDWVLKNVSTAIRDGLLRPTDILARWGGEEFAVILPDTPLEGAKIVAENIRRKIESTTFLLELDDRQEETKLTISAGINCVIPKNDNSYSLDRLIAGADKALYFSKHNGRNKVSVFDDAISRLSIEND